MVNILQCCQRHWRLLRYLPNQTVSPKRPWSSNIICDEEFVRNALLGEQNKAELIRRLESSTVFKKPSEEQTHAAVLIPLCVSDDGRLSILYTRRAAHLKVNAGQVSFPGGKVDDSDNSVADAALRECEEEIGVRPQDIEVWASIMCNIKIHVIPIHPVIGFIKNYNSSNLVINKNEVKEVFTVPIAKLLDPQHHGYTTFRWGWRSPVYKTSPTNVWGTTAIFTEFFLANAFPQNYKSVFKVIPKRSK